MPPVPPGGRPGPGGTVTSLGTVTARPLATESRAAPSRFPTAGPPPQSRVRVPPPPAGTGRARTRTSARARGPGKRLVTLHASNRSPVEAGPGLPGGDPVHRSESRPPIRVDRGQARAMANSPGAPTQGRNSGPGAPTRTQRRRPETRRAARQRGLAEGGDSDPSAARARWEKGGGGWVGGGGDS